MNPEDFAKENARRGLHQYRFLLSRGLMPNYTFLDIGYGPGYGMRCARHVIEHLDEDRYIGIDRLPMESYEFLSHPKRPRFIQDAEFSFPDCKVDFAWAQSVFTHINKRAIKLCLLRLRPVLVGCFYATFNLASKGDKLGPPAGDDSYRSTRWSLRTMESLANVTGYELEYIGDWGHWHGQKMLRFE